jgi:hypothetical protein
MPARSADELVRAGWNDAFLKRYVSTLYWLVRMQIGKLLALQIGSNHAYDL